jgi:Tol biopolymer transport system component
MSIHFKQLLFLPVLVIAVTYSQPAVEAMGDPYVLPIEGSYLAPRFSPDGKQLALTTPHYQGIYLYDWESGTLKELTSEPAAGFGLAWSPDGNWIAARPAKFENRRRYNRIIIIQVNTGEQRQLSPYQTKLPGIPRWTADGKFVFMNLTSRFQSYAIDPTIKPDTDVTLFYVRGKRIYERSLLGRSDKPLLSAPGEVLNMIPNPQQTKIAYEILGDNLWILDLTTGRTYDLGPGSEPTWHPDGEKLAFMVTRDDGHQIIESDIYVVNSDGSGRLKLTETPSVLEMRPDWSPDGKRIVYDTDGWGPIMVQEVR